MRTRLWPLESPAGLFEVEREAQLVVATPLEGVADHLEAAGVACHAGQQRDERGASERFVELIVTSDHGPRQDDAWHVAVELSANAILHHLAPVVPRGLNE